jgi:hypothetical protein
MSTTELYWAANEGEELAGKSLNKIADRYRSQNLSSHRDRIIKVVNSYYGDNDNAPSHEIMPGGVRGELSIININFVRYLVQHTLSLVAGGRLAYKCIPQNTDVSSREQAILGNGLLAAYTRDLRLERHFSRATEYALITSEGFVCLNFDHTKGKDLTDEETGEVIADETGKNMKAGDITVDVLSYFDIARDEDAFGTDSKWLAVRRWVNKFDLAADYPEHAERILALSPDVTSYDDYTSPRNSMTSKNEQVPVWTFRHAKTSALPEGKEWAVIDGSTVLYTGPLPYDSLMIFRIAPGDMLMRPTGYTPAFDILAPIEAMNHLLSTALSNQLAFGVQMVWTQKGDDIDIKTLSTGMTNIQTTGAKPEPLQLTQTPNEIFASIEMYKQLAISLSGLNETSLGTQTQRLSGNAMALLDQKAIQFASVLQESYTHLAESVGQGIIELLQSFADTPRVGAIVGKNNQYALKSFSNKDIDSIQRVVVETVNPALRSFAVRLETANQWLDKGLITSKEDYMSVADSGQIETQIEGPETEDMLIANENEMLRMGKAPITADTDSHIQHILKHRSVISDPSVRENPDIVGPTLMHINEHIMALRMVDPELLMILGQQPSQLNQQAQAMQQQVPSEPGPQQQGADAMAQEQAATQETADPNMGPATGEVVDGPEPMAA